MTEPRTLDLLEQLGVTWLRLRQVVQRSLHQLYPL